MKISQDFLEKFAKVSGDFNPIHLNKKYAKNSYFGEQIVYGIVLLFCSLEMNLKNKKGIFSLEKLDVKFLDFVKKDSIFCIKNKYNKKLDIESKNNKCKEIISTIIQKDSIMAKFSFTLKEKQDNNKTENTLFFYSAKKHINLPCFNIDFNFGLDSIESSVDLIESNYQKAAGAVAYEEEAFPLRLRHARNFVLRRLSVRSGSEALKSCSAVGTGAAIASAKYATNQSGADGFKVKIDSIESTKQEEMKYNSLEFAELFPNCAKKLEYNQIAALLLSTKIVGMKYPGEFSIYSSLTWNKEKFNYKGRIKAFIRPQIPINKTFIELNEKYKNILQKCNLQNEKALVIGASSGLGNAFAKMLSIGGAEVLGSYFSKELDFDIKSFYLNTQKITKESLQKIAQFQPSSVFYFATPKIVAKKFSKNDLLAFIDIYIFGLECILNICKPKIIFAPSSIFVSELPKDFSAYIIAKSAMETYLQILEKECGGGLRFICLD